MNTQDHINKREELKTRLARQEGRISDRMQQYEQLKEQVKKEFGTDDLTALREKYADLKKEQEQLMENVAHGNAVIERAVEALEQGEKIPADVMKGLEDIAQDTSEHDTENHQQASDSEGTEEETQTLKPQFSEQDQPEEFSSEAETDDTPNAEGENEEIPEFDPLTETVTEAEEAKQTTVAEATDRKQKQQEQRPAAKSQLSAFEDSEEYL